MNDMSDASPIPADDPRRDLVLAKPDQDPKLRH